MDARRPLLGSSEKHINAMLLGASTIDKYSLEEEEIFRKYYANTLKANDLLLRFEQAIQNYNQTNPMYEAAMFVRDEGEALLRVMPEDNLKKWKMSMVLALNVLETPKDSPKYLHAVRLLKNNAEHRAIGKADGWKKFTGALAMLAGAAMVGLSFAGIPFTGGASLALFFVGGLFLTTGGAAFFCYNMQKSLAKATDCLSEDAGKESIRPIL